MDTEVHDGRRTLHRHGHRGYGCGLPAGVCRGRSGGGRVADARWCPGRCLGGTWHTAQKVPGTATLNKGGNAQVYSVSCVSAGNCSAGGYYKDGSWHYQALRAAPTCGAA
jgi:hypothetical protein